MRKVLSVTAATAILFFGMNSLPAAAKFGGPGGGGFKSGGFGGGFKSGGFGKFGGFKSAGFHGKGHFGKFHGFKHARFGKFNRFNNALFWGGWPALVDSPSTNVIIRYPDQPVDTAVWPVRPVEPKVFSVGTGGGCSVEHVNVSNGVVNVYRC